MAPAAAFAVESSDPFKVIRPLVFAVSVIAPAFNAPSTVVESAVVWIDRVVVNPADGMESVSTPPPLLITTVVTPAGNAPDTVDVPLPVNPATVVEMVPAVSVIVNAPSVPETEMTLFAPLPLYDR